MDPTPLPFSTRLWFAWACFFRVLFDGAFAARAFAVRDAMPALPPAPESEAPPALKAARTKKASKRDEDGEGEPPDSASAEPENKSAPGSERAPAKAAARAVPAEKTKPSVSLVSALSAEPDKPSVTPALQLLALFQREGQLVDFLQQDVATFSDAEVGAAARVVHEGCRKALRQHAKISPVRGEEEGSPVTIADGYDAHEVKLTGNVTGKPPYKGVLRHKGWRVDEMRVPVPTKDHDAKVIAPAEVEL